MIQTVSPTRDPTLEAIATWLQDGLNQRFPASVAQSSPSDWLPTDPNMFPHLFVFRTDATGRRLELCRGVVRYMLFSCNDRERARGIFRSIELATVELLEQYDDPDFNSQIQSLDDLVSRTRLRGLKQNGGSLFLPFVEIEFSFLDYATL